tara:strand:- start:7776 stop:9350 length:1575 start_codon:yes stop_codon:yes gene_type:complete
LKTKVSILFLLFFNLIFTQEKKIIEIIQAGSFARNEKINPGANILKKNDNMRVHLLHDGMNIYSDYALFYKKKNSFNASGNVVVKQGDSIQLYSETLDYNGNNRKIIAKGNVDFYNNETNLKTNLLYHDRNAKEFFFKEGGIIKDSATIIKSLEGKYFLEYSKYIFNKKVEIENPEYYIQSNKLDYYTKTEQAYFFGPTKIIGADYDIYCEKGFYDTRNKEGYFTRKSKINYNNRLIEGDSLTFNDNSKFASASKNIILTDTINKTIIKGNYAEIFKARDSAMITKRSMVIKMIEKDSLFIKADTLFAIGPSENRIIKGRYNVRIFKKGLSGKSDKILINQKTGLTKLIRNELSERQKQVLTANEIAKINPVLWNGDSQMTGDEIHITRNIKTNDLDSLKILNNAFVVEKDTLGIKNFNQMKGINLFGKFQNNELKTIELIQNTEMIYYLYDDNTNDLIGIDKAICSSIIMEIENNTIKEITFITNPEGEVFPEDEMEISLKILNGFNWRISEKITKKEEIFIK